MFYSYNSCEFGEKIKAIRKSLRLTQSKVSNSVCISIDGLRKIEHGFVTPRFETLVKLSLLYKTNLVKLASSYCKVPNLEQIYNQAQVHIDISNIPALENLKTDLLSLRNEISESGLILIDEYNQLILFCDASILFLKNTPPDLEAAKKIIIKALTLTIEDFKPEKVTDFFFNNFEIRLLHLLALTERRQGQYNKAIELIKHILDIIEVEKDDNDSIKNNILLYFSLSYSYHEIEDYRNCLKYADLGIKFAIQHSRPNELHLLYYRKGIAEYYLGEERYMDALKKSICLLEMMHNFDLAKTFRNITKKNYNITIE